MYATEPIDMDEIAVIEGHYGPGVWKDGYYFSPLYVDSHKGIKQALETGQIEGVPFTVTGRGSDIRVGDTYIFGRNNGLRLLTCTAAHQDLDLIDSVEDKHSYDMRVCIRIELNV